MAKVIEFYIPQIFRRPMKWVPEPQRGKILELRPPTKKVGLACSFHEWLCNSDVPTCGST